MDNFSEAIKALKLLGKLPRDNRKSFVNHTIGFTTVSMTLTEREREFLIKYLLGRRPEIQLGMLDKVTEILGERPYIRDPSSSD